MGDDQINVNHIILYISAIKLNSFKNNAAIFMLFQFKAITLDLKKV